MEGKTDHETSSQSVSLILKGNCLVLKKHYLQGWESVSVRTFELEQVHFLWWGTVWENFQKGNMPSQRFQENQWSGTEFADKATFPLECFFQWN